MGDIWSQDREDEGTLRALETPAIRRGLVGFDDLEVIVTATEDGKILSHLRKAFSDLDLIEVTEDTLVFGITHICLGIGTEVLLEFPTFAILMIHIESMPERIALISTLLIREDIHTIFIEIIHDLENEGDDACDWDMSIRISECIEIEKMWIECAPDDEMPVSRDSSDRIMENIFLSESEEIVVFSLLIEHPCTYDTILSSSDRYEELISRKK